MGKKNKNQQSLGRSLIKDRFGNNRKYVGDKSMLHTTEIQDGYDWGRLNLQSVTEESSFQEFLSTAELAGTEFQAEKLNIKFVNPRSSAGLLSKDEKQKVVDGINKNKELLKIPRRPLWTSDTTPEELQQKEREEFLEWRRTLSILQEEEGLLLTPYEKNLEFWRQLWRVIERSDVVVQIVDARNPLLFRCEDLEKYVREVSQHKDNLILVNKADLLTEEQRKCWADYFSSVNMKVAFFSAVIASEKEKENVFENDESNLEEVKESVNKLNLAVDKVADRLSELTKDISNMLEEYEISSEMPLNTSKLLSRDDLVHLFRTIHTEKKVNEGSTTIGLVGYPNVGKSSTINALLTYKKVSVSAMPGKTKHFQTLFLDRDLILCDCPGLVMPSFVFTKAEMIVNGILPVDQMRDHVPPINLVCNLIPRRVLESTYGIMIPQPLEGEDPERAPLAEELLNAYGYNRGFMTANGQPDNPRSSRYVLKDFVNGKLLYCNAPPNMSQSDYHTWPHCTKATRNFTPRETNAVKTVKTTTEDLDKVFFKESGRGIHAKGVVGKSTGIPANDTTASDMVAKPWKLFNKHKNKNKKEKLRRVYAHMDYN